MVHKKHQRDAIDAWLIGYQGVMPSPVHIGWKIGKEVGVFRDPTLNEWRAMQASSVATDLGMVGLAYAAASEAMAPAATRGASWHLTRLAMVRYASYARFVAGPAGVGAFFAITALQNWTRPTRTVSTVDVGLGLSYQQVTLS